MQDRLREIEGTLARTKERRNTILYKLAKRKQEEERLASLGVQKLPSNPHEVADVKVVKYVLFRLKQEIGDKTARLRDPKLHSIEKDGEAVVRAKNDEINKLISRRNQWETRLATLLGETIPVFKRGKSFFGCAKELPEAETSHKRSREQQDNVGIEESSRTNSSEEDNEVPETSTQHDDVATQDSNYLEKVEWLASSKADDELMREEKGAEAKTREMHDLKGEPTGSSLFVRSYFKNGAITVPSEEYFKNTLIRKRKELLQERLKAMRKN
jgi:pre-mRNA-splicing factor ISY1